MFETFDKILMAGLGAMTITKEKAEQIFDEYLKKGQAQREQKSGFVKELLDSAQKTRTDLEKLVSDQVKKTIAQLPLATKDDLKGLEHKLDKLLSKKG
jgi:polyhydroxyalkanoate synthesis regulator phasin